MDFYFYRQFRVSKMAFEIMRLHRLRYWLMGQICPGLAIRKFLSHNHALQKVLKDAWCQKITFMRQADTIRIVCLGSSHAHKDFYATKDDGAFNFGNSSVDLRLSAELYKWIDGQWHAPGGTVVVFYSVFSDGFQTERTSDAYKCIPYEVLFDIASQYKDSRLKEKAYKLWCLRRSIEFHCDVDYRGNNDYSWFFPKETELAPRVAAHLKHAARRCGQTEWLSTIAALVRAKKRRLFIVLPPYRSDYMKILGKFNYSELNEWLRHNEDVVLLDFGLDKDFINSDFGDADHLNKLGAQKLTAKIIREINKND